MIVKAKSNKEEEINVKYFCGSIEVRYWEDGEVNGEEDISYEEQKTGAKPRMPLVVENPEARRKDEKWLWEIKIDVETGNIVGWPEGTKAQAYYKVCDQGIYWVEDESGNQIHKIGSYVPHILEIGDDCPDGDYVIFTIDENGHIVEWGDANIDRLVEDFMETEGF